MKSNSNSPASVAPCCLTIAGSDSGGNAGVQADLRAFHAYGLHGCTVFAALTAQNPSGVSGVMAVPADFVASQLDAVLGIYSIRALKTGMLADVAAIEAIAARIWAHPEIAKVVDPVMIATSGVRLVSEDAVEAVKRRLLPLATIATPNLPEAEALCGLDPADGARGADAAHAAELAREICGRYGCATLVKGGHGSGQAAVDVLCTRAPDGSFVVREFLTAGGARPTAPDARWPRHSRRNWRSDTESRLRSQARRSTSTAPSRARTWSDPTVACWASHQWSEEECTDGLLQRDGGRGGAERAGAAALVA